RRQAMTRGSIARAASSMRDAIELATMEEGSAMGRSGGMGAAANRAAAIENLVAISHGAPAAALILLVIVVASLFVLLVAPRLLERAVLRPYWLVPRREYATLLTSGFLHADLAHLLFNAFTFW